jgi:sulfur-oxidizing protein SoxY
MAAPAFTRTYRGRSGLMRIYWLTVFALVLFPMADRLLAATPDDPLDSVMWQQMHEGLLKGEPVVFDERVQVEAPEEAEDSLHLPLWVDASALGEVRRLLVFAELNPIPKVLEMEPLRAPARIGLRIKVQQSTPIRAAALTPDGVWHLGGVLVDAAGGGCTAPSLGSGSSDWAERLGEVSARLWQRDGYSRLKARVIHPMDTGLVAGIPAFYLEHVEIRDEAQRLVTRLALFEPISENPVLTLDLPKVQRISLKGRDNNGNPVAAMVISDATEEGAGE